LQRKVLIPGILISKEAALYAVSTFFLKERNSILMTIKESAFKIAFCDARNVHHQ
jgi:hypothetical protein